LDEVTVETPDGRLLFRTGKQFIAKGDRIIAAKAFVIGDRSYKAEIVLVTGQVLRVDGGMTAV
jgi:hypothetical protein